ncbi:MAG TPA: hypothetical protein VFZ31_01455 [Vicinamibacterales bacterium]
MPSAPDWLALLSAIPPGVTPERKPVASAEMLANGTAGPIAGWQSIAVHLSDERGSRHVLITIDEHGKLLSAGDHVMRIRETTAEGLVTVSDHESVGGRYDDQGGFFGTRWANRLECKSGEDDSTMTSSAKSAPSESDVAALNALVADLLRRV